MHMLKFVSFASIIIRQQSKQMKSTIHKHTHTYSPYTGGFPGIADNEFAETNTLYDA